MKEEFSEENNNKPFLATLITRKFKRNISRPDTEVKNT